ncbi:hypothetical protein GCM10027185_54600 [Spirosoma pulveris]
MPLLADDYQVIVIELRGIGGSDKPLAGYFKKGMAGDVSALLDQLGIEHTKIAGHDVGAAVAFSFATHFPEKTEKLSVGIKGSSRVRPFYTGREAP